MTEHSYYRCHTCDNLLVGDSLPFVRSVYFYNKGERSFYVCCGCKLWMQSGNNPPQFHKVK